LAVAALMTSGYGIDCWKLFLQQQGHLSELWAGSIRNASLHGIVLRLITPSCKAQATPSLFSSAVAGILGLALLALAWRLSARYAKHSRSIDVPFALFSVLSAFTNPWIWEHYVVFLILPMLVVLSKVSENVESRFLEWTREKADWRKLTRPAAAWLASTGTLLGILYVLRDDWALKVRLFERHLALGASPEATSIHWKMHYYEVTNWLPWVALIVMLGSLLWKMPNAVLERSPERTQGLSLGISS
jgi:hypothetical protein